MGIYLISYAVPELQIVEEITPFFSPVKICLPWGKELPGIVDEREITVLYPPVDLKPDISFEKTLNDCINWVEEQGEKSRIELVKAGTGTGLSEESFHQIRRLLISGDSDASTLKNIANRYHLLIYLADRIEESRSEANRMLYELKNRPSPLAESLDQTGKTEQSLDALAEINNDFVLEDGYVTYFLNAWFGLFGDVIKDGRILLTLNRLIFDKTSEKWDMLCGEEKLEGEGSLCFKTPLISGLNHKEQENLKNDPAVKEKCAQIEEMICDADIDHVEKEAALGKIIQEFENMFPEDMLNNHMLFTILFFNQPFGRDTPLKDDITKFLSGKALLLAEKVVM